MSGILKELASAVTKLRSLLAPGKLAQPELSTLRATITEILATVWDYEVFAELESSSPCWKEFSSLISSGRIVAVLAEAETILSTQNSSIDKVWAANGREFSKWIARGVVRLAATPSLTPSQLKDLVHLYSRSLSIGYATSMVMIVVNGLVRVDHPNINLYRSFVRDLPPAALRQFLHSLLTIMTESILPVLDLAEANVGRADPRSALIAACASLVDLSLSVCSAEMQKRLITVLLQWPPASTGFYRAMVAGLPQHLVCELLQRLWELFSSKIYIQHTPLALQKAHLRLLMLVLGHVDKALLLPIARSGLHTSGVSARMSSNSEEIRYLGMIFASAVSEKADDESMRLKFDMDEYEYPEKDFLHSLLSVRDAPLNLEDQGWPRLDTKQPADAVSTPAKSRGGTSPALPTTPDIGHRKRIIPYASDPPPYTRPDARSEHYVEPSHFDNAERVKSIVYVRELVEALQDSENHDRRMAALVQGPKLIKRKANFGSELKDRVFELAGISSSLTDPFDMPDFERLRFELMLALLIAQPTLIGPWCAEQCFSGDYSISQRATFMTCLGMGARNLSGHGSEDLALQTTPSRLAAKSHAHFASISPSLDALQKQIASSFTSMSSSPDQHLSKQTVSNIVLVQYMFLPILGKMLSRAIYHSSYTRTKEVIPLAIKTLAIIFTSIGPSVSFTPNLVTEFWDLLLSLRSMALHNPALLEALLFAFLTVLKTLEGSQASMKEHGKVLVETYEWCGVIVEGSSSLPAASESIQGLAAAVTITAKEILDRHHRLLIGDLLGSY